VGDHGIHIAGVVGVAVRHEVVAQRGLLFDQLQTLFGRSPGRDPRESHDGADGIKAARADVELCRGHRSAPLWRLCVDRYPALG